MGDRGGQSQFGAVRCSGSSPSRYRWTIPARQNAECGGVIFFLPDPPANPDYQPKTRLNGCPLLPFPAARPSAPDEYFSVGFLNLDSLLSAMNKGWRVSINSRTESMPGGMHG